jgi:hypothetical protein
VQSLAAAEPDAEVRRPKDFRVLVQTGFLREFSLDLLQKAPEIRGALIDEIDSIDDEVAALLLRGDPGTEVDRVWIFEKDRVPRGTGRAIWLLGGGLVLLGGGIA